MGAVVRPFVGMGRVRRSSRRAGRSQGSLPVCQEGVRRPSYRDGRSREVLQGDGKGWLALLDGRERSRGMGGVWSPHRRSRKIRRPSQRDRRGGETLPKEQEGLRWTGGDGSPPRRDGRIWRPSWKAGGGCEALWEGLVGSGVPQEGREDWEAFLES